MKVHNITDFKNLEKVTECKARKQKIADVFYEYEFQSLYLHSISSIKFTSLSFTLPRQLSL